MTRMPRRPRQDLNIVRTESAERVKSSSETREGSIACFSSMSKYDGLQELYVDKLLTASDESDALSAQTPNLQDLGVFGMC